MIKKFLKKALKIDKMIVKKSDNELVRYIKQSTIIEERRRFEELMRKEEERKAKGLNDKEKRMLYFNTLETLPLKVYDKNYINDNLMEYKYLQDNNTYMLLGQRRRPFFIKPFYQKPGEYSDKVSFRVWLLRFFGSLVLLKAGYDFGIWDGAYVNRQLSQSKVVEFDTEEEIFDYLLNKNKAAVFLELYSPG
jgi:hypothetical protein